MMHLQGAKPADLDKLYNARLSIPNAQDTFDQWGLMSAGTRARFACLLDLPFGDTPLQRLDYFPAQRLANEAAKPLLIFIHGGYWRSRDKNEFSFLVQPYVRAGINVALLNYELIPSTNLLQLCLQVVNGITWLAKRHENLSFDVEQITVAGHSAGGHLAAMAACADWAMLTQGRHVQLVKKFVALSGLFDLAPLMRAPFLRSDLNLTAAQVDATSPALFKAPRNTRGLLAVGQLESAAFYEQSELLAQRWKSVVAPVLVAPDCDHLRICSSMADEKSPLSRALVQLIQDKSEA
jgi:arylformamidase